MSRTTRITEKGQTTIPKPLREKHDLQPGDEVRWVETEQGIVVRKPTRTGARGLLVSEDTPPEGREAVTERLAEEIRDRRETDWTID